MQFFVGMYSIFFNLNPIWTPIEISLCYFIKATRYYDWPPFSREYESADCNV